MHTYRVLTDANGFIKQTHHTCHTHQRACLQHSELACHKRCPRSHIQHAPWALCRFGWHKPWYWAALTRYFTWNATTTQNIRTENKHCTASVHRTKSNAQKLLIYCLPRTNPWIWSESASCTSCTWRYLHTAWSTHLSLENWSKYMAKVSTLICLGHLLGGPSTLIENEPTHVFSFMIYGHLWTIWSWCWAATWSVQVKWLHPKSMCLALARVSGNMETSEIPTSKKRSLSICPNARISIS